MDPLIEQFRALRDDAAALLDQLDDQSEIREEIRRANDYRARTIRSQDEQLGRA